MIRDDIVHAVAAAAREQGIEPPALLAIVDVETGGVPFETDGRTPQFLYERHVAFREAGAKSKALQSAFVRCGLAIPKWDKAKQYQDERTSAQRIQLISKAREIDEEVAHRSASWGLGQTMGNECHELGFESATAMVEFQTGSVANQIDCMIREIRKSKLVDALNGHNWSHVARIYNGPGYAANQYDTKLANAYKRWVRKLPTMTQTDGAPRPIPPEQKLTAAEIKGIQEELRHLGYAEVGTPDGNWDTRTIGAISAFQAHEGLAVTGHYDDATRAALSEALARDASAHRTDTTVKDLRKSGSRTVEHADQITFIGWLKMLFGGIFAGGGALSSWLDLDKIQEGIDQINKAKGVLGSARDLVLPLFSHPGVIVLGVGLMVGGYFVVRFAGKIKLVRLEDHQTGVHAGPAE